MATPVSWRTVPCPTSWGHEDAGVLHPFFAPLFILLLPSSILSSLLPSLSAPSLFLFLKDLHKNRDWSRVGLPDWRGRGQWGCSRDKASVHGLPNFHHLMQSSPGFHDHCGRRLYMEQGTSDPSSLQNRQSFLSSYSSSSSISFFLLHLTMGLKSRSPCYVGHMLSHHAHILVLCCCLRLSHTSQTSFEFAV